MKPSLVLLGICALGSAGLSLLAGCADQSGSERANERLQQASQAALAQQGKQNELIGAQARSLAETSGKIAAAAEAILAKDSLIRSELNQQQASIDASRRELEQERQSLAAQRQREPVIAAALQTGGLLVACLVPLLFGVYVLQTTSRQHPDEALAEVLVSELVSEQPRLLPAAAFGPPRLERPGAAGIHLPDDAPPDGAPF